MPTGFLFSLAQFTIVKCDTQSQLRSELWHLMGPVPARFCLLQVIALFGIIGYKIDLTIRWQKVSG